MNAQPSKAGNRPQNLKFEYLDSTARYSNHAIINSSGDEIFIDFSSGKLPGEPGGPSILPIHTRIAMSPAGAKRLVAALQQSLNRAKVVNQRPDDASGSTFSHVE